MQAANLVELGAHGTRVKDGPFYDHWRRRTVGALGGIMIKDLDDLQKAS